jgi:hypothetical protein
MSKDNKIKDISDLIDDEVILSKNKFISDYTKNALYNFWIDIIKSLFI